ncbi:N-acetyl-gamma-glutamyl-phosphate reductase [Staphylococcus aureus M41648]|nr:N-acetyl-gamma-glutamyl-phosphate reductase [Staphylococcus aureus M41648]
MMITVGIVGGSGYGAIELIRLLQTHPHVTIAHIYSHSKVDEHFHIYNILCNISKHLQWTIMTVM